MSDRRNRVGLRRFFSEVFGELGEFRGDVRATAGETQSALTRPRRDLGFEQYLKLRPARSRVPTSARRLMYSREGREK